MSTRLPIALPVASSSYRRSCRPDTGQEADVQTTPSPNRGAKYSRRRYVTARRLAELEASLSSRDLMVLWTLGRVRLATGGQLARLEFHDVSLRQARAGLASLTERRLLARLCRTVGGVRAGSAGYVYCLDVAGQRLLRRHHERTHRPWTTGMAFVAHTLAVTELYVRLIEAQRAGELRVMDFVTEPASWRTFHGPGGARSVLKPDARVHVLVGGFEDRWFVEVDRGTEATTTVARTCDRYRQYWASGQEQAIAGVFPRVLWLVPDEHRREQLLDVVGRQPADAGVLFAVGLFDAAIQRISEGAAP